ncbi:MAG: cell surface protein SprA [Winogradskyella sp.]|nr:cell surface protein SprA [Winogradskyella sp.]NNK22173.1 cell surface protein SprA [Winogradskyella sp.]
MGELKWVLFLLGFLSILVVYAQTNPTQTDSTKTTVTFGDIKLPKLGSIESKYTYDPVLDRYIYNEKIGGFNINYPLILTPAEFKKLVQRERLNAYYKEQIDAAAGQKEGTEDAQKNLLPSFYLNPGFFSTLFGGDEISVIPQGSVDVDLGVLFSRQDNPTFTPRNRSNFTFDFDQRISMSLTGTVGTRLQVNAQYDTERTFDFQNLVKLEYTPTEDDIIQKIEIGNVNMPLNSSLITGAQSLFGVKTQLQFGKTTVTAVFSEQQSESRSVTAQGGGTLEEFEFFARDYDENRHFFLAQYFEQNYDRAMLTYPYLNNNIQITRIEVWVTNRNNQTQNVRNVVAFQDLGEADRIGLDNPPGGFVNVPSTSFPDDSNNDFDPTNVGGAGSLLNDNVRDITNVQNGIGVQVNEGFDYGILESARKLNQGQEYTLNTQLGYISLNQRLLNDEVLAVAFQYTVGGEVFQVGEFANDGVDATNVVDGTNGNQIVNNQSLILKMLKSAITAVEEPIWDLMMKNIYDTGAFQLSQEDFRLNIFYTEASPLNYITPAEVNGVPVPFAQLYDNNTFISGDDSEIEDTALIRLFHLDRLNFNGDPQEGGDGFFDFVPGQTVLVQNGKIIFTKVQPFGNYLFDVLDDPNDLTEDYENTATYNPNQEKYVYDLLYKSTKTQALDAAEKNKFQIKGRFKSSGSGGIPIPFNAARGSVRVTANGQLLVEGIDYVVNYPAARVEILDESLKASNTPINVDVENNALFGQQTRRFTGVNVEHQFNEDFLLGATLLNLNERPITQKANFDSEPINNTIFGMNGNYATEVPFLTRLVNKLPNIDTDAPSNFSIRGEFAYLAPGAPKGTDFNGEATAYIDDFEGTQGNIDLLSPLVWSLSSRPRNLGRVYAQGNEDDPGIQNGFDRAFLNWYTIDPIFYGPQRPSEITDEDVSDLYTRRVFIREIFPEIDLIQGQQAVINTLDLVYYPTERGPYNFDPSASNNQPLNPNDSWAGITRQITTTDFEQANVEYIEFWVQDPFLDDSTNQGGKLTVNLGNISEDVLKDGKKQFENGLPEDGNIDFLQNINLQTPYAVPQNQSLIYTFGTTGQERINQDVGYDGYDDAEEQGFLDTLTGLGQPFGGDYGPDPSLDNYRYFLNTDGNIFERYRQYNGFEGNTPEEFSQTNRGNTTQPDVEDINRDNTMNTIDSYFEYEVDITPNTLNANNPRINDVKVASVTLPNGSTRDVTWYQFRLPISEPTNAVGGITDIRSVRFARLYLTEFTQNTVMRFASLDLVRSDWRRFTQDLDTDTTNDSPDAEFNVAIIGIQENDGNYVIPPGVRREELNNNNNVVRQNEQSLVLEACDLVDTDSQGVFKNVNLDMRQYKKLRMFLHAQPQENQSLEDDELVAFIRLGNDFTENFYQVEIPLKNSELITDAVSLERTIWPEDNEINIPLEFLQEIKSRGISNQTLANENPTYYDVIDGELSETPALEFPEDEDGNGTFGIENTRVAIKGNPNFGNVRVLMVGLKHSGKNRTSACGEVWFNELRMSDLENEGGWAAIMAMDTNLADFATISASGNRSTVGFGGIEQSPNERSREDVIGYDVITNVKLGQLLPKKWGINLPLSYSQAEETIKPQFDAFYNDLTLESRINAAESSAEAEEIERQSETYTKRRSINFIGVKKQRTGDKPARFYDIENFTLNYSNNKIQRRDFEIERSLQQNIRVGANYTHTFQPKKIEPFKKNDSLFTGKYWKIFKDFNLNLLPTNFSINTDINRDFNSQKFREVALAGNNIGIEEVFRRNYTFDFQYAINYNLSDNLSINYTANNNNIVRNYFIDDRLNGRQDPELDVWDGFFDFGDPNIQNQQLLVNYNLPFDKIPILSFLQSTYTYNSNFQWQKGSDINLNFEQRDNNGDLQGTFNLGNTIQNSNAHTLNTTLNMEALYKELGIKKANTPNRNRSRRTSGSTRNNTRQNSSPKKKSAGRKIGNTFLDILTMVKRINVNYVENNGTFLPGYINTPGFIGTLKPTLGYTFGSQRDIRQTVARNGWLTLFPEFNQQYTENTDTRLDFTAALEPMRDLKIDLIGSRNYQENFTENFRVEDFLDAQGELGTDGVLDYRSLTPNSFGNFNITTSLIGTAFGKSDANQSATFDDFKANRIIIARRLALQDGVDINNTDNLDTEGFPEGYGKNSQKVLLPAFLSAYHGSNPESVSLGAFRDIPIPNWQLKYTGLMKLPWFRKNFKRFSLQHGYRSTYSINQFRTNLDYDPSLFQPGVEFESQNQDVIDQGGNYKSEKLFSSINLEESFSPLFRIEATMKNSLQVTAEMRTSRLLLLSFDNNLMTEEQSKEYTLGLGYRIKNVRLFKKLSGNRNGNVNSDLNITLDANVRDNLTIIRYLDLENNQITAGQTIWGAKLNAQYDLNRNITGIFFFDYSFSDFAISTSFPQTSVRSGFTLRYNFGN